MKPPIYRRIRYTPSHEAKITKRDIQQEQPFFGGALYKTFFQSASFIQRKSANCEDDKKVQRRADKNKEEKLDRMEEKKEEEKVQKKAAGTNLDGSKNTSNYISTLNGKGNPLPPHVHHFFSSKMGYDFSAVKIHTGKEAAESAKSINAKAYTIGNNIVFNEGQFNTCSRVGQKLIAHELTHVIQQDKLNLVNRDIDFDECDSPQEPIVRKGHKRALDMAMNAMQKLNSYDGTKPTDVSAALLRRFDTTDKFWADNIKSTLALAYASSDGTTYECEHSESGHLGWALWCVPFSDIVLYPGWFKVDDDVKARVMIHEWIHRYICNLDLGYHTKTGSGGHGTFRSLLNADSYAWLCYDLR